MTVQEIWFSDIDRVEVRSTVDDPPPGAGEVLLAPSYVGICGSDLHLLHGHHPWTRPPVVAGHEVSARVSAVGSGVGNVSVGDAVLVNPLVHCGVCRQCGRGQVNLCESARVLGFRLPGAGRTSVVHRADLLHVVPAHVPLDVSCLAEPLAAAWHATKRCPDLDDVLVTGGGSIGLSVILALREKGARRITLVEPSPTKRALALDIGADTAFEPSDLPSGARFTSALDCVGRSSTVQAAAEVVVGGGTVVVVGVPDGPTTVPLPRMQRYEIDLHGSGMYLPEDIDAAVAAIADGRVEVSRLISRVLPLIEAAQAYAHAGTRDSVKVLIRMQ